MVNTNSKITKILLSTFVVYLVLGTVIVYAQTDGVILLEPEVIGQTVTGTQQVKVTLAEYLVPLYRRSIQAAGLIAILSFMAAGVYYMLPGEAFGANDTKGRAKEIIRRTLYGLLLLLLGYSILRLVNPALVSFSSGAIIPALGAPPTVTTTPAPGNSSAQPGTGSGSTGGGEQPQNTRETDSLGKPKITSSITHIIDDEYHKGTGYELARRVSTITDDDAYISVPLAEKDQFPLGTAVIIDDPTTGRSFETIVGAYHYGTNHGLISKKVAAILNEYGSPDRPARHPISYTFIK